MMTNLFSTFDPATSMNLSMNWMSSMMCMLLIPITYWALPNRINILFNTISSTLNKEFKMLINPKEKGMTLMMVSLFMMILVNNYLGLLPYVFTSSSHMTFTMTLSIPLWLSFMIYGWVNHTNHMFAHMVPTGTPPLLMPFMVLIETISNLIRPGALAVRLSANMIAGHLLMSLLGNNAMNSEGLALILIIMVQIVLMMFESAVALIQAYVFSVLSTLYSSEVM
uniref:ATP synthase subunit a n=1 Tax=Stenophyella macreta TaxID=2813424 RepID=A0A8T9ZWX5_9HEMI|nr:ATPase subunit 6 [Stenophyella macreta]